MNPKKILHNTTFSVQLPYIACHSLQGYRCKTDKEGYLQSTRELFKNNPFKEDKIRRKGTSIRGKEEGRWICPVMLSRLV